MNSNLSYFEESFLHQEALINPNYHLAIEKKVIPERKEIKNPLTISNEKVIQYVTTIDTLVRDLKHSYESDDVLAILEKIIIELDTEGMNYSSLSQYFNVHNVNHSLFVKKSKAEKIEILKFVMPYYLADHHTMYLSHGYSDIVLQVMCDNYSHKRKGSYGAKKIALVLSEKGLMDLSQDANPDLRRESFYLLADKTGKKLFRKFAKEKGVRLSDPGRTTEKFPDALIKIGSEYYVVEQKNMKEGGGGQSKQAREVISFIFHSPEFKGLHYVTYMDGDFLNTLKTRTDSVSRQQYADIIQSLKQYPANYFVNDFAFDKLMQDALQKLRVNG